MIRPARTLLGLAAVLASLPAAAQRPERAAPTPTLVVFITVDQLRPDYFDRWAGQLNGGLARLRKGGAFFTNGFQDHAITETAPGHASTMSGRFPGSTGIIQNTAGVNDPASPLIGVNGSGASPFRFKGTTLFDWLDNKDKRSRALSVSRKDRGAILPIGRAKEEVYWYAGNGTFTTSSYYRDTLPTWVQRYNNRYPITQYVGKAWTPLLSDSAYTEPDSVATENRGQFTTFPHAVPSDPTAASRVLPNFPYMDEVTLSFALEGLQSLKLGSGPQTDVLAVSLSATDAIGHAFGPDSRELHDQIIRLDRMLGVFFDSLYKLRDSSRVIVAMTADHGVAPLPGTRSRDPNSAGQYVDLWRAWQTTSAQLRRAGVDSAMVEFDEGIVYADRDALKKAKLDPDSVIMSLATTLRAIPGVLRVDRVRTLAAQDTVKDYVARRWLHMVGPGSKAELVVTLGLYSYAGGESGAYATHGSPHDYDAHVPIVFYGPKIKAGTYSRVVRVVDMAPTLAAAVGVKPMEKLDGRVLKEALK